ERVPLPAPDDVQVPDVLDRLVARGQLDVRFGEQLCVEGGVAPPVVVPSVQPRKLRAKKGGLESVQPSVEALDPMVVLGRLAVVPELAYASIDFRVVRHDDACVATCAEVLRR